MCRFALLVCFILVSILFVASSGSKAAACFAASMDDSKAFQKPIHFFDVPEMPLIIKDTILISASGGYILKCSVSNLSDEHIMGFRLMLLVLDSTGRMRDTVSWVEGVELADYSLEQLSLKLPLKLKVRANDRLVMTVKMVFGEKSVWGAVKQKKQF